MIIRHYYSFPKHVSKKLKGHALDKENWDIIRNDGNTPFFSIPESKTSYDLFCSEQVVFRKHARLVLEALEKEGIPKKGKVCSLGIGIGVLEWHLKKYNPDLILCCAEYAEKGLQKVASMLGAEKFLVFDMCRDDFVLLSEYDCLLMYRVSTEFDFNTWKEIFKRAHQACCERICFVPTEFATFMDAVREWKGHMKSVLKGNKDVFCGWLYSENEFKKMFMDYYEIEYIQKVDNTGIIILKRK